MKAYQPTTTEDNLRPSTNPAKCFNVVVAYEGITGAIYSHEAIGSLTMVLGREVEVHTDTWSFGMLQRLDLRHIALREATQADLIIVSATSALPPYVEAWLIGCLREVDEPRPMLAALYPELEGAEAQMQGLSDGLAGIAARWHTPFLCNGEIDCWMENGQAAEFVNRKPHNRSQPFIAPIEEPVPVSVYGGFNE